MHGGGSLIELSTMQLKKQLILLVVKMQRIDLIGENGIHYGT